MCYPATVAANLPQTPISCQSSSTSTRTADDCPLPPQKINRYTDLERLHDAKQHDEDRQDLPLFPQLRIDRLPSPDGSDTRPRLLQLQQRKRSFTEYQLSLETNKPLYNKSTIDLSSESLTTLSFKSLSLSTTPKSYLSPKKKMSLLPFNNDEIMSEQQTMKRRRRSGLLDEYSHTALSVEIDDLRLSHPRAA